MRSSLLILVLLLGGCYIDPNGGETPAPPGPVNPDLSGVALEAYQAVKESDCKPEELTGLIGAMKLTVSKAGALRWDADRINQDFLESVKGVFAGNSTAESRWKAYDQWQVKTLKPITDAGEMIYTLNEIIKGLEAANG